MVLRSICLLDFEFAFSRNLGTCSADPMLRNLPPRSLTILDRTT